MSMRKQCWHTLDPGAAGATLISRLAPFKQLYKLTRKYPELRKEIRATVVIEIVGDSTWTIDMKHSKGTVGPVSTP